MSDICLIVTNIYQATINKISGAFVVISRYLLPVKKLGIFKEFFLILENRQFL